jgi:hypothetical protein
MSPIQGGEASARVSLPFSSPILDLLPPNSLTLEDSLPVSQDANLDLLLHRSIANSATGNRLWCLPLHSVFEDLLNCSFADDSLVIQLWQQIDDATFDVIDETVDDVIDEDRHPQSLGCGHGLPMGFDVEADNEA